jgi:hypothetical protein
MEKNTVSLHRLTTKQKSGEVRNERVARAGQAEVEHGQFSHGTKNREGAIPGADGGRRY